MLTQHSKSFGKKKQSGEDILFTISSKGEHSRGRGIGCDQSSFRGSGIGQSKGRSNNFQGSNFQQGSNSIRSQTKRPQNQNNQTRRDMSQITCRRCNRVGHFAADCRQLNNKLPKYKQPSNSAQYANDSDQEKKKDESGFEFVFSSIQPSQTLLSTNSDFEDAWLLYTGET